MRLEFVEVSGFRGFRDKVRVTFGLGFTVITGRNGVGKSTIFDAVEYALTGSIAKYAVEKAAQESLSDYLWWRGNGVAESHYVKTSFITDAGESFCVTRTRETGPDKTSLEIERALCTAARPEHALNQLCKTSIIRDEWIAALSLDLSEVDRFEHVRGALGIGQEADLAARAKAVLKAAEAIHSSRVQAYEGLRTQLNVMLTQLAQQKEAVVRAGDVSAAMRLVVNAAPDARAELHAQLEAGRAALARRRSRLGAMGEAAFQGREIQSYKRQLRSPEADAQRQLAQQAFGIASREKENATRSVEEAERALEIEERGNDIAASLAILLEHGERLGLHDDACPEAD
jgi:chromosome segregation protein